MLKASDEEREANKTASNFWFPLMPPKRTWVSLSHAQHKTYSNMLGHPNTASKCTQTSNRTVHSKRQTDRITAQRKKTCHTKSALHTRIRPGTPCATKWKFSSSHQVSASACVFVGGRRATCTGVIVDRCPLKLLCTTDSCLVCTPVAGGATVCVHPNLPLSIPLSLSLPSFFLLSISFILPLPSSPTFLFDWLI